jgi:hypothetical protein
MTIKATNFSMSDGAVSPRRTLQIDLARLLGTPLSNQLLGEDMSADLYARNGFRFVGARASADPTVLESGSQLFRNRLKIDPAAAVQSCIQTGYDLLVRLEVEDIKECVSDLNNPRRRLLCELFWPHVSDDLFDHMKNNRHVASPQVMQALTQAAGRSNGRTGVLIRHALAVAHHNRALAHELAFIAGEVEWSDEHWASALSFWGEVLEADVFWDYLRERVKGFDDLRLHPDDVEVLRIQLPAIILGFHTLFAQAYAKAEAPATCFRHVGIINRCGLSVAARQEALRSTVRVLANARLEPLIQRANAELSPASGKLGRKPFDAACSPILSDAFAVLKYLVDTLNLPGNLVELAEFDSFCETILGAVAGHLDYSTDDRLRSILYSMLVSKRMLGLPMSLTMRQKLEKSIRDDIEILYRGFLPPSPDFDPTRCWFMESEEPDPDACIELSVYKIVETRGASVRWESRRVLVPRSKHAKLVHEGKLKVTDIEEDKLDAEGQALLAQIRDAESKCKAIVATETRDREVEIKREESALKTALAQYDRRVAAQVVADERHLAEVKRHTDRQIELEHQRRDNAIADVTRRSAQRTAQAQAAHNRAVERNKGLRGGRRLEMPLMMAAVSILGMVGFMLSLADSWLTLAAVDVSLSVIFGLGMGRVVRGRRVGASSAALAAVRKAIEREIDAVKRESQQAVKKLEQQATRAGAEAAARLKQVATEKARLTKESENRMAAIRSKHEQAIDKAQKAAAVQIRPWQKRLTDRVRGKPESAKKDFPPYTKAKSSGYRDGAKPSDREVNDLVQREFNRMMDSLDPLAKIILARIVQEAPGQADQIIASLMEMSPGERNQKLRSTLNL